MVENLVTAASAHGRSKLVVVQLGRIGVGLGGQEELRDVFLHSIGFLTRFQRWFATGCFSVRVSMLDR